MRGVTCSPTCIARIHFPHVLTSPPELLRRLIDASSSISTPSLLPTKRMDASSHAGDLGRDDDNDLPGTSPGGVRPVEEYVGSESPPNPEDQVSGAGLMIAPPEHLTTPTNTVGQQAAEHGAGTAELGSSVSPWDQIMQTLSPENRTFFSNLYDGTHRLISEISNNHERMGFSTEELQSYVGVPDNHGRVTSTLDPEAALIISRSFDELQEQLAQLYPTVQARHAVIGLLNYLIVTNSRSLDPDSAKSDASHNTCVICFEKYGASQVVVALPCHRSHHFHRSCIQNWLLSLIPGPPTCPICRTHIVL